MLCVQTHFWPLRLTLPPPPPPLQVKFTSAVKLSEGGAVGAEYTRDEEENFFKRLGKWRSGRRNPSKLHHTEEKDGRPPPPWGAPYPPTPHCPLLI